MWDFFAQNKAIQRIISISSILSIIILIVMLGFTFPADYHIFVNLFFIFFLSITLLRGIADIVRRRHNIIPRVLFFDIVSIIFVCYCIYIQIDDYSWYYVSKYLQFAVILKLIRENATPKLNFKRKLITPPQLFIISFILLVFLGSLLLMVPKATYNSISYLDALFTATSAVCVTGLTVVDTYEAFTPLGHVFILILIQAGALGLLTFMSYITYFFKGNSSYESQLTLESLSSNDSMDEIFSFVKRIVILTFGIEALGALFIFFSVNSTNQPLMDRVFFSVFHSISAFCNAGFSIVPNGLMNTQLKYNYNFQSILIVLIICGGIGFPILVNVLKYFKYLINKYIGKYTNNQGITKCWIFTLSSKINLITTTTITIIATIIIFFEEYYRTLLPHEGIGKVISAAFVAVTPRTAGFNNIDFAQLHFSTTLLIILLMWIGASPASTGGGIKTGTFALAILNFINMARGKQKVEVFRREIPAVNIQKAFATMTLSFLVIGIGIFLISKFEHNSSLINIAFEVFSAYSTVGLTLNLTPTLTDPSKVVIVIIMFIGRVSMITILMAFFKKTSDAEYTYPTGDVLI